MSKHAQSLPLGTSVARREETLTESSSGKMSSYSQ